jgi:serine/threonine-protein kinase
MNATLSDSFGHYRLQRLIGRGGATAVYLAGDCKLGRNVALKILGASDAELRARFLMEARTAARLRHPHIVAISDVGEVGGRAFVAMDYVEGETFAALIRRAALPLSKRLDLANQLADGLRYAHQMGVIHGDLRPVNVMVDQADVVTLVDFGVGRVTTSAGLTVPHIPIGPFNYMSPEQLSGGVVNQRSDIFSFGALIFELLSYHQAFPGPRNTRLIQRIQAGQYEPLHAVCPDLPEEVVAFVDRLLEPHVPERFASFEDVIHALANVRASILLLSERATQAVPEPEATGPESPQVAPVETVAETRVTDTKALHAASPVLRAPFAPALANAHSAPEVAGPAVSSPFARPAIEGFDAAEAILRRIDELDPRRSDLTDLLREFDRAESVARSRSSASEPEALPPAANQRR